MTAIGILVTFLGFVLSVLSVGISTNNNVRLLLVLAGIAISLFGIIGIINRVYLAKAIWRK